MVGVAILYGLPGSDVSDYQVTKKSSVETGNQAFLVQTGEQNECQTGTHEQDGVLCEFRSGSTRILASTDVDWNGINIQAISLYLNYDLPEDAKDYLGRVGRKGRFGQSGTVVSFVTKQDVHLLKHIMEHHNTQIEDTANCEYDILS